MMRLQWIISYLFFEIFHDGYELLLLFQKGKRKLLEKVSWIISSDTICDTYIIWVWGSEYGVETRNSYTHLWVPFKYSSGLFVATTSISPV